MNLIDTHAHIYLEQFKEDIDEVIDRCSDVEIHKIFMPNIDDTSIDDMLRLEDDYPGYCISMMGLHPCSVDKHFERQLYIVEKWISDRNFSAIGEIGTDLYWDKTFWAQQKEAIRVQLGWARQKKWPAVIHCRESIEETIEIVEEMSDENLAGIFHCFTGTPEQAKRVIELGFYLGIGGVSTFKNGGLEDVIKETDIRFLVLETDSPYLAPVPHRGKRNEPSYINFIAKRVAQIKGIDQLEVAETTSENATRIFSHVL